MYATLLVVCKHIQRIRKLHQFGVNAKPISITTPMRTAIIITFFRLQQ